MPRLDELLEWCKSEIRKGKAHLHTNHVVIIEEQVKQRIENKPEATRIQWETGDPDIYKLFHVEKERYMVAAAHNPVLATEAMIMALKVQDSESVRRFIEAIQKQERHP